MYSNVQRKKYDPNQMNYLKQHQKLISITKTLDIEYGGITRELYILSAYHLPQHSTLFYSVKKLAKLNDFLLQNFFKIWLYVEVLFSIRTTQAPIFLWSKVRYYVHHTAPTLHHQTTTCFTFCLPLC